MLAQLLDLIAKAGQNARVLATLGEDRVFQLVMCIGIEHSASWSRSWGEVGVRSPGLSQRHEALLTRRSRVIAGRRLPVSRSAPDRGLVRGLLPTDDALRKPSLHRTLLCPPDPMAPTERAERQAPQWLAWYSSMSLP